MINENENLGLQLVGILIGLSKACYMHEKSPNTDKLIIDSLAMVSKDSCASEEDIAQQILLARQEKSTVAPGCLTCASPCGNTEDFDFEKLDHADKETRQIKYEILSVLQSICSSVKELSIKDINDDTLRLIHRGLSVISYDLPLSRLQATLDDLRINNSFIV